MEATEASGVDGWENCVLGGGDLESVGTDDWPLAAVELSVDEGPCGTENGIVGGCELDAVCSNDGLTPISILSCFAFCPDRRRSLTPGPRGNGLSKLEDLD